MKRLVILLALAAVPVAALCQKGAPRQKKDIIARGAVPVLIADSFGFTEGPAADRRGNVYFTDQPNNKIFVWGVDGKLREFLSEAGRANGLYFDGRGNLLAAADGMNELWSIAPDGSHTVLAKDFDDKKLNGPNDVWVHPRTGAIYFTDPLYARPYWSHRDGRIQQDGEHVYRVASDGSGMVRVATDLKKPNGIVGTPDGKTLYVADIGAGKTWAYDIAPDGTLSGKRLFAPMGSDGMTIDDKGNVYLTGQGVTVFDPAGEQIAHIDIPKKWTANVAFGGRDRRTLFITASEAVYSLKMNVKGVK